MEDTTQVVEDQIDLNDTKEEVKTTFTLEEVEEMKKKMQSDSEKGVQKIIAEKKNYERMIDWIGEVAKDNSKLIDIYEENPVVAQMILDKYYDGQNIEAFKKSIWYEENLADPKIVEKVVSSRVKAELEKKLIESGKADFISKLKLTGDELKNFEEAFAERTQLKSFNTDDLTKHLEKAYREIPGVDTKTLNEAANIAKVMATWEGKAWNETAKKDALQEEIGSFLSTYG